MNNFCPENRNFLENCLKNRNISKLSLKKSKYFESLPGKIRFFLRNCLMKSKFLGNLPGKTEILLTRVHDPQISNQIDSAESFSSPPSLEATLVNGLTISGY